MNDYVNKTDSDKEARKNDLKPRDAALTEFTGWELAALVLLLFRLKNPNATNAASKYYNPADPQGLYYAKFEDQVADFAGALPQSNKFKPLVTSFAAAVAGGTLADKFNAAHLAIADLLNTMDAQNLWSGCQPVPPGLLVSIAELDDPTA